MATYQCGLEPKRDEVKANDDFHLHVDICCGAGYCCSKHCRREAAPRPQCGFASTEEGNILAEDQQWAKLRMIVELAEEIWG